MDLSPPALELLRTIADDPRSRYPVSSEAFAVAAGLERAGLLELEAPMMRLSDLRRAPWRQGLSVQDRRPHHARLTRAGRRALERST